MQFWPEEGVNGHCKISKAYFSFEVKQNIHARIIKTENQTN